MNPNTTVEDAEQTEGIIYSEEVDYEPDGFFLGRFPPHENRRKNLFDYLDQFRCSAQIIW